MSNIIKSQTLANGLRVEVMIDDDPESPVNNWDMVGTMVLVDRCRYAFGHERKSRDEIREIYNDPQNIVLPVFMYDHSGITINTTGFSCPWDSGQVGIIYCTKQKAVEEWGKKLCTKKVREKAEDYMRGEVECIDQYLTGQVYGFKVMKGEDDVDSCWGFYGSADDCLKEGLAAASTY